MTKYKYIADSDSLQMSNVDVYNYDMVFDWRRWGAKTKIRLLRVCWDNRYDNVVKFADDEARDQWIEDRTEAQYVLESEQWIESNKSIKLPVPFNVAMRYNYIAVEYPKPPIEYGDNQQIDRIMYFIDNVKQIAPSTTELELSIDYWTTFINSTTFSYAMLMRGHAPMSAAADPETFLSNPLDNSGYLLSPDVNYDTGSERVISVGSYIFNDSDMLAVFATTSDNASAAWGTNGDDSMRIPGLIIEQYTGVSNYDMIAVPVSQLGAFMVAVKSTRDWWLDSVVCMYYIARKMVDLYPPFNFCGVQVSRIKQKRITTNITALTVDSYGYSDNYKRITKLYTSPYAHLEIRDESGNGTMINIDEIGAGGQVAMTACANLVAPGLNINAHLLNLGSSDKIAQTFAQSELLQTVIGGDWASHMQSWSIPTYAVIEDQQLRQQWYRYWTNKQARVAADTAYAGSIDSASVGWNNTNRSADNALSTTMSSNQATLDNMTTSNTNTVETNNLQNAANMYTMFVQQKANKAILDANIELTESQLWQSIATGAAGTALSGATGGAAAGGVGAAIGAIGGTVIGAASSAIGTGNIITNNKTLYDINQKNIATQVEIMSGDTSPVEIDAGVPVSSDRDGVSKRITAKNISTNVEITQRSVNTSNANADASTNVAKTNNTDSRDLANRQAQRSLDVANSAIDTGNRGAMLAPPAVHGSMSNTGTALTSPMGVWATLHRQSDTALAAAGDQMLRYGYAYSGAWDIKELQVMQHYTYWQLEDVWLDCGRPGIEEAADVIHDIMVAGTTVWSNPEEIGRVSIYDNWRATKNV